MAIVNSPPISKENNEDSGDGIYFKVDLSNSYELFSTFLDTLITTKDIKNILLDTNISRTLKIMYFKCIAECVILYADIDHMSVDNYQMIEDIYHNFNMQHYDIEDPIIKSKLILLSGIVRYKFAEFENFPCPITPEQLPNNEILFSMEKLLDVIVKNIITVSYNKFYTKDKRLVSLEAGDDIEIISWEENISHYDWQSHNLNANVVLTLKLVY